MAVETITARQLGREALVAMRTIAEAVDVARAVERDATTGVLTKADASPATIADFSVQALVAARLGRDCPLDALIAEETAAALRRAPDLSTRVVDAVRRADPSLHAGEILDWIDRGGGSPTSRFWTLDPIDGTKGLLRGGQYAIALALVVEGAVQLGALGCPRLRLGRRPHTGGSDRGEGGIAIALRGRGAWWSGRPHRPLARLSVSRVTDPAQARVLHSVETPHSDVDTLRRVAELLAVAPAPLLMDSQAKHAVIASGSGDVLLRFPVLRDYHDAIWDQAAGALLIEEAGGRVTDLAGRALDFGVGRRLAKNRGLVATNGVLHDAVLVAVETVLRNRSRQS